ncbi:MAG: hypothetical protein ABRQ23_01965 [Syntrophomonadaceae bacterium]
MVKKSVGLCANGLDYVITQSASGIENKYGENALVQTASEIGSSSLRATEMTVKRLADIADGGIEAGVGYLTKDEASVKSGWKQSTSAGKELVAGVGKGIAYTVAAGAKTTSSAVQAGKHYVQGNKTLTHQELGQTKVHAKRFAKIMVAGLLTFGPVNCDDKDKLDKG